MKPSATIRQRRSKWRASLAAAALLGAGVIAVASRGADPERTLPRNPDAAAPREICRRRDVLALSRPEAISLSL